MTKDSLHLELTSCSNLDIHNKNGEVICRKEGRLLYIYIAGPLILGIIYIHVLCSDAKGHPALPAASPMLVSVAVDRAVDTK